MGHRADPTGCSRDLGIPVLVRGRQEPAPDLDHVGSVTLTAGACTAPPPPHPHPQVPLTAPSSLFGHQPLRLPGPTRHTSCSPHPHCDMQASPTGLKGKAAPPLIQGTDRHFRKRGVGVPLQARDRAQRCGFWHFEVKQVSMTATECLLLPHGNLTCHHTPSPWHHPPALHLCRMRAGWWTLPGRSASRASTPPAAALAETALLGCGRDRLPDDMLFGRVWMCQRRLWSRNCTLP